MRRLPVIVLIVFLGALGGCQDNQQMGAMLGAGSGGALGAALGKAFGKSNTATVLGGLAGGAVGYFVGSSIGRSLDQRDQERAQAATVAALNAPVEVPPPTQPHARRKVPATHRPAAKWASDHTTGTKGSATVTEVSASNEGNECRVVHEVAYISGREVVQDTRYCRDANNQWQNAAS